MGPQNGILGIEDSMTMLPETHVAEEQLAAERKMARFSQSTEFQVLRDHLLERIQFYQQFLPDGRDVRSVDPVLAGQQWIVANAVIGECNAILSAYEAAGKAVEKHDAGR